MELETEAIRDFAKKDFRRAWIETASLVPDDGPDFSCGAGKPHMMHEAIHAVRRAFLDLGFDEAENQVFLPEEDVYRQYGPEAPVILDRCYYLGGLPRPDIGLSNDKMLAVRKVADISEDELKSVFRRYKEGRIEGDDFLETMVGEFGITTDQAADIIGIFPGFKNIRPVCGKTTLRSHMTGGWFPTLAALADEAPQKLFSCGLRFRREQKVDSSHLRAHYGGSCVIMAEDISLKAGMRLTEKVLKSLDFGGVRYVKKAATSNYYAPQTEYEVYSGQIEVADIGMYSPVALAQYGIRHNVFNLGFGLERILMVKHGIDDVRRVLYPQFYRSDALDDSEIASMISIAKTPVTDEGIKLAKSLKRAFKDNKDEPSPCSFKAFEGNLAGKDVIVEVFEREDKSRLCGPAAFNGIYVHEGSVYGLPNDTSSLKKDVSDIVLDGKRASFDFMDAICSLFASNMEDDVGGSECGSYHVKMVKTPAEANIKISDRARKAIESNNRKISVKGPVFCAARFKIE